MKKKEIKQITHIIYFLGLHLGLINCYKIKISAEGLLRIVISLGEKMAIFLDRLTRKNMSLIYISVLLDCSSFGFSFKLIAVSLEPYFSHKYQDNAK